MPNPIETTTIDGIPLTTIQAAAEEYIEGFVRGYNQAGKVFALIIGGAGLIGIGGAILLVERHERKKLEIHQFNNPSRRTE